MWGLLLLIVMMFFLLTFHKRGVMSPQETVQTPGGARLEPQTAQIGFNPKANCLRQEWIWKEYESLAWCESYRLCGQTIPECPGGNKNWSEIRESSRICKTTAAHGYRVYCHVERRETEEK